MTNKWSKEKLLPLWATKYVDRHSLVLASMKLVFIHNKAPL